MEEKHKQPQRQPTATERLFGALNNAYRYFNYTLFNSELPNCVLNFSRLKSAKGFFAPDHWRERQSDDYIHEISLTPHTLYREPIDIFSTLVHEMCHLWQWEFGNYSRNGYHNKEWADKMESIGLIPSHNGEIGGKKTGQKMTHYIIENGEYAYAFRNMPKEFVLPFTTLEGEILKSLIEGKSSPTNAPIKTKKGKVGRTRGANKTKYSCPCGKNVWGRADLYLMCGECGEDFQAKS